MKILVIDDSDAIRHQVRQALSGAGYEIMEAFDGLDGLDKLRTLPDLDLALCDMNMPRMNGLEVIMEAHREALKTPIIMLTTEGQPSMIRRARDAGAKGWIVKPFKPDLLVAAVTKIVTAKAA